MYNSAMSFLKSWRGKLILGFAVLVIGGVVVSGSHVQISPEVKSTSTVVIKKDFETVEAPSTLASVSATPILEIVSTPTPTPVPTPVSTPTPIPKPVPIKGNVQTNTYINVDGNTVQSPLKTPTIPAGASAKCGDGTYSFSQHRSGTCSHHGGVAVWY